MADWLTQQNRFMQLTTPLGADKLLPLRFSGTERVSGLFDFNLHLLSDEIDIDGQQLLSQPICLTLCVNESARYFHGRVTSFHAGPLANGARRYHAKVEPWLALLGYTTDCRIFHHKSVIDIAKLLFQEFGFSDFDLQGLTRSYAKRDCCTQYRETSLHFLQRLFQEEGIFYYFSHRMDRHILCLVDSNQILNICEKKVVFDSGSRKNFGINSWQRQKNFYSGQHALGDYNYQLPGDSLYSQQSGSAKLSSADRFSCYDYPGGYQDGNTGSNWSQQRLQACESNYDVVNAIGNYANFSAGTKFTLNDAPVSSDIGDYLLTRIKHTASDASYLSGATGEQLYNNQFTCVPANSQFRPTLVGNKPLIHGAQTASVVGQEGSELYTDEHGRVKVQFHWDRRGQTDENSSGWIRVAQAWAGAGWGTQFMPRIGQEVVVHFLEGNPDRPLITGSVYNGNNQTPYDLPASQTQSGIKTQSSLYAGTADYNELRFEDKQGDEEIFIQAQKDFNQVIKNNLALTVGSDLGQTIKNSLKIQVGNTALLEAKKSIVLQVGSTMLRLTADGVVIKAATIEMDKD